jgi:hypothetical protein
MVFQQNGVISHTIMTNYVKRFPEKVLAACRRLFSEDAAKTDILNGQLVSGGATDSDKSMATVNWPNKHIL